MRLAYMCYNRGWHRRWRNLVCHLIGLHHSSTRLAAIRPSAAQRSISRRPNRCFGKSLRGHVWLPSIKFPFGIVVFLQTHTVRSERALAYHLIDSVLLSLCSGQPRIWDSDPGEKHIVYEAFTADGTCLPPVIFTTRETEASTEPDGRFRDENGNPAYVVYIPGFAGPSEASTAAWLEKMTDRHENYFDDKPHIILDSLKGHFTEVMRGDWENIKATLHRLPAASGKWLNPCDQSINREMRREFLRLQQLNRRDKIRNIIRAYYSIKEETIRKSFTRCGVFDGDPDDIISAQACQGYQAKGHREELLQGYRVAFLDWAQLNTRELADMLPRTPPPSALDKGLDGEYWNAYGNSRSRRGSKRSVPK